MKVSKKEKVITSNNIGREIKDPDTNNNIHSGSKSVNNILSGQTQMIIRHRKYLDHTGKDIDQHAMQSKSSKESS